ncbi:MAG: ribulose-phosphate 3-epimerase [Candidatus Omnitrophota bacterium]|nr:MAG: ribulose-phosphate 3-epimerase [Candidatus Omnitrophota bacterium]
MKRIVPAILTDRREVFLDMLDRCAGFTDYVQIDIMDGEFVPSKSIGVSDLEAVKSPVGSEAHLMVNAPLKWVDAFKRFGSRRIIFHFEIKGDHLKVIDKIRSEGMGPALAVNPLTKLDDFKFLVDKIDSVLFMSVNPGFYGAAFIPEVLEKIREFKRVFPEKEAGIDGGIKLSNVKDVLSSGLDYICVGSAIFNDGNPGKVYEQFLRLING